MNETTGYIVIIVVLIVGFLIAPQLRLRAAIPRVIRAFRQAQALDSASAKTLDELGLRGTVRSPSFFGASDPIQTVLNTLRDAGIIQGTSEGRWFLSESRLAASKWKDAPKATSGQK